jgi:hypothetical protein
LPATPSAKPKQKHPQGISTPSPAGRRPIAYPADGSPAHDDSGHVVTRRSRASSICFKSL